MPPYYEKDGITIYHGDCREILPSLDDFDLLLTDPPYGIGEAAGKNKSRSNAASAKDYGVSDWDDSPIETELLDLCRSKAKWQIIFGGNYYPLPSSSCWLVWDKQNGNNDFADCELAWTNLRKAVRKFSWRWNGMIRKNNEPRFHPTQKPFSVMSWAMSQAPGDCKSVLDPFMGSGTTLVAAKNNNLTAVGIEMQEEYCETAAVRLSQEMLILEGQA